MIILFFQLKNKGGIYLLSDLTHKLGGALLNTPVPRWLPNWRTGDHSMEANVKSHRVPMLPVRSTSLSFIHFIV